MLHSVGKLLESHVLASDGTSGRVLDAYFDERSWEIRYLLIQVGDAGAAREIIFSAEAVTAIDREASRVLVGLLPPPDPRIGQQIERLRSSRRVLGCAVAGWTGSLGQAEDAIFEAESWTLRFLMVDMSECRAGSIAFIQPDLIEAASWDEKALRIAVTHVEVLRDPDIEFDESLEAINLPARLPRCVH